MSIEILNNEQVYLLSKENESFIISKEVAKLSQLLKTIIEKETQITLNLISSQNLQKIVEFMNYYSNNPFKDIERPIKSTNLKDFIPEWYINFLNINNDTLFELINFSNYLDIKPLLDLTCAKVATMIKGKSNADIINTFNIVLQPEEKVLDELF